jgi:RNA polymerase sigma-70 factor (ECF subfamily)
MDDDRSANLLARWREGDQQAAAELFERYTGRLIALVRSRLPEKVRQRVDPEDVVQSVYRIFFSGAGEGRYTLERGGDLWRLLVTISLHKLYRHLEHNTAGKRDVGREQNFIDLGAGSAISGLLSREPTPVEAVALADEVQQIMARLDPLERQMLELRLQGHNLEEIASQTHRSLRTVCRVLDEVKREMQHVTFEQSSS